MLSPILEHLVDLTVQLREDRAALSGEMEDSEKTVAVGRYYGAQVGLAIQALTKASGKAGMLKALRDVSSNAVYLLNVADYVSPDVIAGAIQDGFKGRAHPSLEKIRATRGSRKASTRMPKPAASGRGSAPTRRRRKVS